jgi:hypothetical protein
VCVCVCVCEGNRFRKAGLDCNVFKLSVSKSLGYE